MAEGTENNKGEEKAYPQNYEEAAAPKEKADGVNTVSIPNSSSPLFLMGYEGPEFFNGMNGSMLMMAQPQNWQVPPSAPAQQQGSWTCSCGAENTGRFCRECGSPRPVAPKASESWTCSCGAENTGRFCPECGSPRPVAPESWTCSCGAKNTGKFCPECGSPRPEAPKVSESWTCSCGTYNTGKFCSGCGSLRPEQ